MVTRFPTILRDKDHMILAVPLCITESFAVWHDKLPLGGTLSGSPKGVCRLDSRNCQTLGVPRQSRGFTMIKLCLLLNQYGLVVGWECATANVPDQTFQWLIRQVDGRMMVLSDTGFHAAEGDPRNLKV